MIYRQIYKFIVLLIFLVIIIRVSKFMISLQFTLCTYIKGAYVRHTKKIFFQPISVKLSKQFGPRTMPPDLTKLFMTLQYYVSAPPK